MGKTTATANLGVALASAGFRVVCIDGDIGLRNLDVVMGLENRIVYDLVDIIEGRCKLRQALIKDKRLSDLYLIPAAQTRDETAVSPQDMIRVVKDLKSDFDWVLIDSPAGIEHGFRSGLVDPPAVLIQGNAHVGDEIFTSFTGELAEFGYLAFSRQPAAELYSSNPLMRYLFDWYYMRMVIYITPRRILWWDQANFNRKPHEMEVCHVD